MVLKWKQIESETTSTIGITYTITAYRAKVPGGWFVSLSTASNSPFFYPDPEHLWDGSSLP